MLPAAILMAVFCVAALVVAFLRPNRTASPAGPLVFAALCGGCSLIYFGVWLAS